MLFPLHRMCECDTILRFNEYVGFVEKTSPNRMSLNWMRCFGNNFKLHYKLLGHVKCQNWNYNFNGLWTVAKIMQHISCMSENKKLLNAVSFLGISCQNFFEMLKASVGHRNESFGWMIQKWGCSGNAEEFKIIQNIAKKYILNRMFLQIFQLNNWLIKISYY